MKNVKTLKVLSAAAIASSILFSQAAPAFAQEVMYAPAQVETFEESAAKTLTYQVMLDTHGGSMSVHSVDSDENGKVVLPEETPVKDGYTFLGWSEDPESGEVSHQPGDEITLTNDMKLYAVWQEDAPVVTYQVMLDTHGGSMSVDHVDSDESGVAVLPTEVPVKDGCTFLGWAEDPESGVVSYQPGDEITLTNDIKLYAVWQAETPVVKYTVTFDATGGTLSYNTIESDDEGVVTLPAEAPKKDGYKFLGWSVSPNSTQVAWQPGNTIKLTGNLNLYAVWQDEKKVNTGVENNMMAFALMGTAALAAAGTMLTLKKEEK